MTIHEAVNASVRQPLLAVFFLLLAAQMTLIFASFRDERSRKLRLGLLLHFLCSFFLFYLPMLDIEYQRYSPGTIAPSPGFLRAFGSLPVIVMILYEALTAVILLAASLDLLRYRKNHPTARSIKETMDLLPVGVVFGKPDGTVVFCNLAMDQLSRSLTGRRLTDLTAFRNAVSVAAENSTETDMQVTVPGGAATWWLASETLDVNGEPFLQVTATDISQQAAITRELEEKNKTLRDIHMRLNIYNRQAEQIIIAQELLTARMAVHNELGSVLLESRHYLNEPSAINEDILLQALRSTNTYLLREYEQDDTQRDALTDALETAQTIGVCVDVNGVLPTGEPQRGILAAAVTECATNTVKHAEGDTIFLEIRDTDDRLVYLLTSNGVPPKEKITETGGLLSLRALVEKDNGVMLLESTPQVRLTIILPNADESSGTDPQWELS